MRNTMREALGAKGLGVRENIAGARYYTIGAALDLGLPNVVTSQIT